MLLKDRPLTCLLLIVIIFLSLSVQSCSSNSTNINDNDNTTPILSCEIVNIFPHDPEAFTQGLIWDDGYLYESTGLYGSSSLRQVELKTGKAIKNIPLADNYFAEGITIFDDKIFLLTWREEMGFIYTRDTFQLLDTFSYPYEGWGITTDGDFLIISDGTPVLHFLDPKTLDEIKQVKVHDGLFLVNWINELEYIEGYIYANIWQSDRIAVIEPGTGKIVFWLDLYGILDNVQHHENVDVLNGIAYDAENNRLFVTGKLWPAIFEIKMIET
ncbi:MAG TPA: glutaminyl-peptide cyclotransferase, partial [Atribacterota bacterium]|nr:glutaminyl-peptide cyclotransferase [Atribacterota bacterium]